jgi:hypothetical protein
MPTVDLEKLITSEISSNSSLNDTSSSTQGHGWHDLKGRPPSNPFETATRSKHVTFPSDSQIADAKFCEDNDDDLDGDNQSEISITTTTSSLVGDNKVFKRKVIR